MIKSCWKSDPDKRPSFTEIEKHTPWLSDYTQNVKKIVTMESLMNIFERNSSEQPVSFAAFADHLRTTYKLPTYNFSSSTSVDPKDINNRILATLLQVNISAEKKEVTYEKAKVFGKWFSKISGKELLKYMDGICSKPWFFGVYSEKQTNDLFKVSKLKSGLFMVRWDIPKNCFVLNYLKKK